MSVLNISPILAQGEETLDPVADPAADPVAEIASEPTPDAQLDAALDDAADKAGAALTGDTDAMIQLAQQYLLPIVWAAAILIIAWIVANIASGMTRRSLQKAKIDETLSRFFGKMVRYLILVMGVMFALGKFGIDVTSFAAILAAAGFAVGMALSGTLSNFAAGVLILIFRPFKVGDYVVIAGQEGTVEEVELFTTTLNTLDNRHIIVPNGTITGDVIENVTHNPHRRVDVNVGADYGADLNATRAALEAGIANVQGVVASPAPEVYLMELGGSSVDWQVRVWCHPDHYWDVRQRLTAAAKQSLDGAGISIPFPQMDVHMDQAG